MSKYYYKEIDLGLGRKLTISYGTGHMQNVSIYINDEEILDLWDNQLDWIIELGKEIERIRKIEEEYK
jgi:hypothetical protein